MLLLAIDTAGRSGGVALARGEASRCDIIATAAIAGGSYSARLMPEIAGLLAANHLNKTQVEGIAVAGGPGSFTGLRVGIATAKALAEALGKPIIAISVLEAIAAAGLQQHSGPQPSRVIALQDAGRGETYAGVFLVAAARLTREDELLFKNAELPGRLAEIAAGLIIAAEPVAPAADMPAAANILSIPAPDAKWIARLGVQKLARGDAADVSQLDANYIRRSDAELYSLPELQKKLQR